MHTYIHTYIQAPKETSILRMAESRLKQLEKDLKQAEGMSERFQSPNWYVCMYACMHVCVLKQLEKDLKQAEGMSERFQSPNWYVCMYACMFIKTIRQGSGMYVCIYVCMYVSMHV
jgi:hypothetical protein